MDTATTERPLPNTSDLLALLAAVARADTVAPEALRPAQRAFAAIRQRFPDSEACLLLRGRGPHPRRPVCLSGARGPSRPTPERGPVIAGLLQVAALHSRPLVLRAEAKPTLPLSCREAGYDWAVPLPFGARQRVIGGLVVHGRGASPTPEELVFLEGLANTTCLGLLAARAIPITETEDVSRALDTVLEAQETERARISRELHDGVSQSLTTLILRLGSVDRMVTEEAAKAELAGARALATQIIGDVRRISRDLRPAVLDELGLGAALEALCNEFSERHGIHAEAYHLDQDCPCRSMTIDLALYRIAQEALQNIARHSQATEVGVVLACRDAVVTVQVEDNGVGFDPRRVDARGGHLGIMGMRERAAMLGGRVAIESRPGRGTTIYAEIPADFEVGPRGAR
jgi:signal transduction histidine kinase